MPLAEWTRQTAVILTGAFLFTKHVAQLMIDQGRRQHHQHCLHCRPSRRAVEHRLLHGQERSAQFHALGGDGAGRIRHPCHSLTPTATDAAEGLARAAEWGVPFRRPNSPRRRGFLSAATPGYRSASAPVQRTTPKLPCFLPQMMPP